MAIEWPLVLFSLLAGVGGCTFAYEGLADVLKVGSKSRFAIAVVSLAAVIIGGFCSVLHLASPENVMSAVWNLGSFSGISIELMLIGVNVVIMVIYLVLVKRESAGSAMNVLAVLGIVAGLALAFFTGHGYVLESQAAWNTNLLPLAYLGTALAAGAFLYETCASGLQVGDEELGKISVFVAAGAILGALTIVFYLIAVGFGAASTSPVVTYFGLLICGVAVTAICGVMVLLKKQLGSALTVPVVGLVAALIGALALRCFMWIVGTGYLDLFTAASAGRTILF